MGFTHYYRNKPAFTDAQWAAFCKDVRDILNKHADVVGDAHGNGEKPHVGRAEISFNGIGEDSHETCYVPKAATEFEFCKTARKPYDVAVVEVYRLIHKYLPSTELSSDGGDEVFNGQKIIINDKWTYYSNGLDVSVGDIVLMPSKFKGGDWEGTVTAIGSDYQGPCKSIISIVKKAVLPVPSRLVKDEIADIIKDYGVASIAADDAADRIMGAIIDRLKG